MYNEVESVAELVDRIASAASGVGRSYEIVLVDDGSSDGTAAALLALHAKRADVIVAGALCLERACEAVGAGALTVSTRGLRYGIALKCF